MKRSEIAVRCQGLGEVVARLVELAEGDPPRPVDHGSCVKPADGGVVVQFESPKSETISSAVQIWSVTPAAIAGVLR